MIGVKGTRFDSGLSLGVRKVQGQRMSGVPEKAGPSSPTQEVEEEEEGEEEGEEEEEEKEERQDPLCVRRGL